MLFVKGSGKARRMKGNLELQDEESAQNTSLLPKFLTCWAIPNVLTSQVSCEVAEASEVSLSLALQRSRAYPLSNLRCFKAGEALGCKCKESRGESCCKHRSSHP